MSVNQELQRDGTVGFLPHRLNRHPVVVRGLTADELWISAGLSAAAGLAASVPLVWLTGTIAMLPTVMLAAVAAGIFIGGGIVRRRKRGRPDTWLYRQLQWRVAHRCTSLAPYVGGASFVTRSGRWTVRRRAR